jgi:hypothetical protein
VVALNTPGTLEHSRLLEELTQRFTEKTQRYTELAAINPLLGGARGGF